MTIFHDKLGNRLAMTETDALALGYTYKHKGLKMSEKVNQECSSMTANKLATEIEFTAIPCLQEVATMLRQQQAEIDFLKKEILEKHEDWKHEGQQAANARAEIEMLKAKLSLWEEFGRQVVGTTSNEGTR